MLAGRQKYVWQSYPYARHLHALFQAFMELYSQILDNGGPAFGVILRHVRDHPETGCIFHCTGMQCGVFPFKILALLYLQNLTVLF